jgi:ribonuclease HII
VKVQIDLPTLEIEQSLWQRGYRFVAGIDEAGRGAWAGPVAAAAVILPPDDAGLAEHLRGVRDSKKLSAKQRERLLESVLGCAVAWGVGMVPPDEIDELGIVVATQKAMGQALQALSPQADYLLIDYLRLPEAEVPQTSLPHGDGRILSIAAASILAKVSRDRVMIDLEARFPGYGFEQHKGYGTQQHRDALSRIGPSGIHRLSFRPLRDLIVGDERTMPSTTDGCIGADLIDS